MSDIYCKCGEPWDLDTLHEWVDENYDVDSIRKENGRINQDAYDILFATARKEFRSHGCKMFGTSHSNCNPAAGDTFAAIDDIMGDDVDGAISMMEDAEILGLF